MEVSLTAYQRNLRAREAPKNTKKIKSAVLSVQRVFVAKMRPNGHIFRKKSEWALFRQYASTDR